MFLLAPIAVHDICSDWEVTWETAGDSCRITEAMTNFIFSFIQKGKYSEVVGRHGS